MLTTADQDRRGEVLAFADRHGGWILNRNKPADAALRFEHPGAFYGAPSVRRIWTWPTGLSSTFCSGRSRLF